MSTLPNFTETDIADLWRVRLEEKYVEDSAKEVRRHAEAEVLRRAADQDATILDTPLGPIKITYSNDYSYDTRIVEGDFLELCERHGLMDDYRLRVQANYKINKTWLNGLLKRGAEFREVIERMTQTSTGSPSLTGPTLEDIENAEAKEDKIL